MSEEAYVQSRIREADEWRGRYAHLALKCDALEKRLASAREEIERVSWKLKRIPIVALEVSAAETVIECWKTLDAILADKEAKDE